MARGFIRTFQLEAFTPTERVCRTEVVSVMFPATDGQVGVWSGHAPMVARIGLGQLLIETDDREKHTFFIEGGFAHVRENRMTLLTEECIAAEDIDAEEVWEELQQAKRLPTGTDEEFEARDQAIERAREKFAIAQKMNRYKKKHA